MNSSSFSAILLHQHELLLLLSNSSSNLLLNLCQLQLAPQNLVLLLLQSALCLRQRSLQLQLLGLEALPDFVNLVDGAATLADLIHDVLDLVGQSLVLTTNFVQLEHGL